MKPSACGLGLTLLHEHDQCPACGWPAGDHPRFTGRHGVVALVEPDPAPPLVAADPGVKLAPPAEDGAQRAASPEPAPFVVESSRPVQGQPRPRSARALRIAARAALALARLLEE